LDSGCSKRITEDTSKLVNITWKHSRLWL